MALARHCREQLDAAELRVSVVEEAAGGMTERPLPEEPGMSEEDRLESFLRECRERVDGDLAARLPPEDAPPARLHQAMRYAVFSGGKRLRPALAYAAALAGGADPAKATPIAAAVELVHAYSLVHDDLPAMDDDDLRRGRPHRAREATGRPCAILVGDALQAARLRAGLASSRGSARRGWCAAGSRMRPARELVGRGAGGRHLALSGLREPGRRSQSEITSIHLTEDRGPVSAFRLSARGADQRVCPGPRAARPGRLCGRTTGTAFPARSDDLRGRRSRASARCCR